MDSIIEYIDSDVYNITYFGIGTANNSKHQFPDFLNHYIFDYTCRLILIDPIHELPPKFITEYECSIINTINLRELVIYDILYNDILVKIIVLKDSIEVKNLYDFTNNLCKIICKNKEQILIGYSNAGHKLYDLNKQIFNNNIEIQDKIKKQFLLDCSYTEYYGCFPESLLPLINTNKLELINVTLDTLANNIEYYRSLDWNPNLYKQFYDYINYYVSNIKNNEYLSFRQAHLNNINKEMSTKLYLDKILELINLLGSLIPNFHKYTYESFYDIYINNDIYKIQNVFSNIIETIMIAIKN